MRTVGGKHAEQEVEGWPLHTKIPDLIQVFFLKYIYFSVSLSFLASYHAVYFT